ncbi:polymer-forming cytoskeletal protein [Acidihalobacter prosperus]|uniref:Polymer-forming cytoskeletal protein n=1 Tax=Acidihalobacter prosperus TaxID=160660 RepID=A0A1A6C0L4_9GAMM|nr:polymer-forming cytoskeletal protein [Acidihalobacter prosperus]OBS08107.1 hypothetical protein Thpro_022357 [Acidihalobacter prosperus]
MLLGLIILTLVLAVLPLVSALMVWLTGKEAAPLALSEDGYRPDYLARRFAAKFGAIGTGLALAGEGVLHHPLESGEDVLVVPATRGHPATLDPVDPDKGRVVLAQGGLFVPANTRWLREIWARGDLVAGSGGLYRALLADGDMRLGVATTVLRWSHAERHLEAGADCRLFGHTSAGEIIRIGSGCAFEFLIAPWIVAGDVPDTPPERWIRQSGGGRGRRADMIAKSSLLLPAGTHCRGSVKAHKRLVLGRDTVVEGAVVCRGDVVIGPGCRIKGPVVADGLLTVAPGCLIGDPDVQASVTAHRIEIHAGVTVCGSVQARDSGHVVAE